MRLAALLLVLGLSSIWPAVARAQTATELLNTQVTPGTHALAVLYSSAQSIGTIGTDAFTHRGFDYRIVQLDAISAGATNTKVCMRFASPYEHTLDHTESLRQITFHVGSSSLAVVDAHPGANREYCWYPRVANTDFDLQDSVEVGLRVTTIDAPPVLSISSSPSNGDTYLIGETIRFALSFPLPRHTRLRVTGSPSLGVKIGERVVQADLSLVGSRYIEFSHTVAAGDVDADGVSVASNRIAGSRALRLNGALIRNTSTTLTLNLEFEALPARAGHKVNGDMSDTTGPVLTNATVPAT